MNPNMTIFKVATALGQFQKLATLIDPENGNDRWRALQDWLNENPKYRKIFEAYLHMTPNEAADALALHISNEYNIPLPMLGVLDKSGKIRESAVRAIGHVQELYKERENKDAN